MQKIYLLGFAFIASLGAGAQELVKLKTNTNQPTKSEIRAQWDKFTHSKGSTLTHTKAAEVFLEEDFEAGAIPNNWTLDQANSVGWEADTADIAARWSPTSRLGDLWFAVSNDSKADDGSNSNDASADFLITPATDLSNVSSAAMKVDIYFNPTFSSSTASIEASTDGSTWTSVYTVTADAEWQNDIIISLDAFAGQSAVQVRFGHNDGGAHASGFAIDNVTIKESVVNLGLTLDFNIYSKIPNAQVYDIPLAGNVTNYEYETATGVTLTSGVVDPSATNTPLVGAISPVFNGQQSEDFDFTPSYAQSENGVYTFSFDLTSVEPDDSTADNSISFTSEVTDTLFARDNGDVNSNALMGKSVDIGFGIPFDIYTGNVFSFVAEDTITGVEFVFGSDAVPGDEYIINLYGFANNEPDVATVLASTTSITKTAASGTTEKVFVPIAGGFYQPNAGDTIFAGAELVGNSGVTYIGADTTGLVSTNGSFIHLDAGFIALPLQSDAIALRLVLGEFDPAAAKADVLFADANLGSEYASTPLSQTSALDLSATLTNVDGGTAENIEVSVNVLVDGASAYSNTVSTADLAGGATSPAVSVGTFTPSVAGLYQVVYNLSTSSEESNVANNVTDTAAFFVTDSIYNRAFAQIAGVYTFGPNVDVGLGAGDLTFGSTYDLINEDTLTQLSIIFYGDEQAGDQFQVNIYDAAGGAPFVNYLTSSDILTVATSGTNQTPSLGTFTFGGGLTLAAGSYYFEVEALATTNNQSRLFAMSPAIITEGKAYLTTQGQDLDIATSFQTPFVPIMELVFGTAETVGVNELTLAEVTVYPNPAINVINTKNAEGSNFRLISITGKTVKTGSITSNNASVSISDLKSGIYFMEFAGSVNGTVKIIKE